MVSLLSGACHGSNEGLNGEQREEFSPYEYIGAPMWRVVLEPEEDVVWTYGPNGVCGYQIVKRQKHD